MRKLIAGIASGTLFLMSAMPVFAVKPANNLASANDVTWHHSGAIMPVPPYGSSDVAGSDVLSKLIVNQPNGSVETAMTGVMKGLLPNTEYTVFLSNTYTPYHPSQMATNWTWNVLSGTYLHKMTITSYNPATGVFSGTGIWPEGTDKSGTYTDETITGQVIGDQMTFTVTYLGPYSPDSVWTVTGTIQTDGSVTGTVPWTWSTSTGTFTRSIGSTEWPGLFSSTVPAFTFMTDVDGAGSWHLNLRDANFNNTPGSYPMSVWVNGGGATVLISDPFTVVVN